MLRITALFLILFSVLLTMGWPRSYDEAPSVPFVWQYDLREGRQTARPPSLSNAEPFNLVFATVAPGNAAEEQTGEDEPEQTAAAPEDAPARAAGEAGRFLLGPAGPPVVLEKGERVFAPFHGNGFFRYAKIGRELSFLARSGEELWRKPYKAYPVSDPRGDLVLLLTGDNNRIDVIDPSGNPFGVRSVSGNFMTDLDFAARRSAAALVFSTGAVTVLNEDAQRILSYEHESRDQPLFVKSCALGPDARVVAIHMLAGDQDRIVVIEINGGEDPENLSPEDYRVLRTIDLNATYPHLLHFAVNRHGLVLAAPDRTEFYALAGGEDRSLGAPVAAGGTAPEDAAPATTRVPPVYRPVFADRDYFVFGRDDVAVLLDREGRALTRLIVDGAQDDKTFRILPGPLEDQFALHNPRRVEIYRFAPADSD